jgi:Tol biopolymer transport system component
MAKLNGPAASPSPPEAFAASTEDDHSPAFSPSGDRLAFISTRSGQDEVWVSRSDGGGSFQLTSVGKASWPQWSHDGGTILFSSEGPDNVHVYAIAASGGQPRRLTGGNSHNCMAIYSADGASIYFASNREDGFQLWRMPANGGEPVRITRRGGHAVKESPDGRTLYYTKDHGAVSSLWSVPSQGGEELQVAGVVVADAFSPAGSGVYYIGWSAAGRRASIEHLSTARAASTLLRLPEGVAARGLAISPDRRVLLYAMDVGVTTDLMLADNLR